MTEHPVARSPPLSRVPPAATTNPSPPSLVVIGCGALARELLAILDGVPGVRLTCLAASLHNRPERIPDAVRARLAEVRAEHGPETRVFVAYADCGTGGALDAALEGTGVERLAGAHCYEAYAGSEAFAALSDAEPGTFYLTDFLARQFDTLVWKGLKLDRHPQLVPIMFGNYRRLVYLAQTDDAGLDALAADAAARLGLVYERRLAGIGRLGALLPVVA
ncbi:MAG TPA: DUF1638 domain-containing protein [Candidatus Limnocylindrales bacterium]|nr:DUF1638 domain-containing protein [Candidatus Limnocylindrales bacterium]